MSNLQKGFIKIASALAPGFVTRLAYDKLTNPQLKKLRERELKVLEESESMIVPFKGFDIKLYHWRGDGPSILLIHGWEGQAGNFTDIIAKLRKRGNDIIAFDAPSHGFSSKGPTSLFEFTELVAKFIRDYSVRRLISHSFGGVATTYGLFNNLDLEIDRYLLITVPDRFTDRIQMVSDAVGISDKVVNRLKARIEEEYGTSVESLNVSDFVKKINVAKALILHDEDDRVLPLRYSKQVVANWSEAALELVSGTGHFRILRDPQVIERVASWINEP